MKKRLILVLALLLLLTGCGKEEASTDDADILVPKQTEAPETEALLAEVLAPYVGKLDALVLGCTHYPFAAKAISRILGEQVQLLDGGDGTARETKRRLEAAGLLRQGEGEVVIEDSAPVSEILELAWRLLDQPEM